MSILSKVRLMAFVAILAGGPVVPASGKGAEETPPCTFGDCWNCENPPGFCWEPLEGSSCSSMGCVFEGFCYTGAPPNLKLRVICDCPPCPLP